VSIPPEVKQEKPDLPDTELGIVVEKCFNNRSLSNIINNLVFKAGVRKSGAFNR
jgi:hypothetical protein